MRTAEEVKAYFQNDRFAVGLTGVEIIDVAPGYAKTRLKIEEHHKNCTGYVMGGVYFTMADLTLSAAANQDPKEVCVALSAQIEFISNCRGGVIYGESRVQRKGTKITFVETRIFDEENTLLAFISSNSYNVAEKRDG
ncbi:MAG: PaaI family thioesterase [Lachnospiraceae bacterium]|nr:PaaI family thioesterase [Lachnospiraceae bacterium]